MFTAVRLIRNKIIRDKINKRMDRLLSLMKEEKDIVDSSFGDWDKVNLYLFKAKSTMRALRKINNVLKNTK